MNEKKERFKRVTESRVNKILDMLELLGNCSYTGNYEYTDAEVKKIFDAIELEIEIQKKKFKKKGKEKFYL